MHLARMYDMRPMMKRAFDEEITRVALTILAS
jgi:hypothetical protein